RAAPRPLPGRPEARRHGHWFRPFEEAELLGQGAPARRREGSRRAVRFVGFGCVAGRHPGRSSQEPLRLSIIPTNAGMMVVTRTMARPDSPGGLLLFLSSG